MLRSAMRPRWAPIFWVRGLFWLQKPPAFNVVANDRLDKHGRNWKQLSRQQRCRSQGQGLASWGQQAASKVRNAEVSRARSRRPGRRGGQGGPAGSAQGAAPAPAPAGRTLRRPPPPRAPRRLAHAGLPRCPVPTGGDACRAPARARRAHPAPRRPRRGDRPSPGRGPRPRGRPRRPGLPRPRGPRRPRSHLRPGLGPVELTAHRRGGSAHRALNFPATDASATGGARPASQPRQSAPPVSQSGARPRGPGCEHARCARPRPGRRRAGAAGREPLAAEAVGMRSSARAALGHGGVRHAQ